MDLIVAAHPDDESTGASSILFRHSGAWVAHVTDGVPRHLRDARAPGVASREEYAAVRDHEARAALAHAGVPPTRRVALGIADREVPLRLAAVSRSLHDLFERLRPTVVITHAYEGGHPDHDAVCFAVHAAAALLRAAGSPTPALVEMTSCHRGPRGSRASSLGRGGQSEIVHRLDAAERARKREVLARYATQRVALRHRPDHDERFRPAPRYDFTEPPHAGALEYESFPWGMTGERFRDLVQYALLELGLRQEVEPSPCGTPATRSGDEERPHLQRRRAW